MKGHVAPNVLGKFKMIFIDKGWNEGRKKNMEIKKEEVKEEIY